MSESSTAAVAVAADAAAAAASQPAKKLISLQGSPVQVVVSNPDHTFTLNDSILSSILTDPSVANKKVVIVSVAGAFRRGKSFLLDFFLRYLSHEGSEDWMSDESQPLKGFSWRTGSDRETTGIWLWSSPFIRKLPNGEEVALFLMDTQGTFDTQSTVRDNATIFGLSTLLSSTQVYNVTQSIKEDDLQHLQLFTEYGQLASTGELEADKSAKAFQRLLVLVRDWSFTKDHPLGAEGGRTYLDKVLKITEGQHDDLKSVRLHINTSFEKVDCYLLPHPGLDIVEDPDYDGRLSEIRKNFKDTLSGLVQSTLAVENIFAKKVNGEEITCRELLNYFVAYVKIYQSSDLPVPKTALQATAEANNISAKDSAFFEYEKKMEKLCKGAYVYPEQFEEHHENFRKQSLDSFQKIKKLGGKGFSDKFQIDLLAQIERCHLNFQKLNETKGHLAGIKTPITLVLLFVITYVLSYAWVDEVLFFFGLFKTAFFLEISFWAITIAILTYALTKLSGVENHYMKQGIRHLDIVADLIWEQGLGQFVDRASKLGLRLITGAAVGAAGGAAPKTKTE